MPYTYKVYNKEGVEIFSSCNDNSNFRVENFPPFNDNSNFKDGYINDQVPTSQKSKWGYFKEYYFKLPWYRKILPFFLLISLIPEDKISHKITFFISTLILLLIDLFDKFDSLISDSENERWIQILKELKHAVQPNSADIESFTPFYLFFDKFDSLISDSENKRRKKEKKLAVQPKRADIESFTPSK